MKGPKLRISKYIEPWKSYTISELFDRVGTPVDLDENEEYQEIGIRSHGKGLFYKDKTTAKEIGNKRVFWIEPDCFVVNIVFAWERAVAKTTQAEVGMIASHRFPMYKPKEGMVDLDYITQYFTTKRGQNVLILASPGGAGRNKTLGQKEFAESRIMLPSFDEQKDISKLLASVDEAISLIEEDVRLWEEKKRGVMQKIFSQEVRFKDENGEDYPEWKNVHIGDILKICHGRDYKHLAEGEYPVLGTGGIMTYVNEYLCDWPCALIGRKGTIDRPQYMETPFWSVDTLFFSKPEEGQNPKFQYYLFQTINWKQYNAASGVPSLSASVIEEISVYVPCNREQQAIVECFTAIDEVISIKKQKLETWKNIKKGLLQQMFV